MADRRGPVDSDKLAADASYSVPEFVSRGFYSDQVDYLRRVKVVSMTFTNSSAPAGF